MKNSSKKFFNEADVFEFLTSQGFVVSSVSDIKDIDDYKSYFDATILIKDMNYGLFFLVSNFDFQIFKDSQANLMSHELFGDLSLKWVEFLAKKKIEYVEAYEEFYHQRISEIDKEAIRNIEKYKILISKIENNRDENLKELNMKKEIIDGIVSKQRGNE